MPRPKLRTSTLDGWGLCALLCGALFGPAVVRAGAAPSADAARAVFEQRCQACHSDAAAMGGISLTKLAAEDSVGRSFQQWQKVIDVLEDGRMPPEGMPQPTAEERADAAGWVRGELDAYAQAHSGDPGRVTVRRLTSGEYDYVIRDLTGLRHRSRPAASCSDAVGGEGFTNFGDVQFMQDASFERYLEAAKTVADHAVVGAGPLTFYGDPGMSGFELSAIHRIHDIYREHGFRAVAAEGGLAFGLERYGKAFYAAWQFQHRGALRLGEGGDARETGQREGLSPRFMEHVWSVLTGAGSQLSDLRGALAVGGAARAGRRERGASARRLHQDAGVRHQLAALAVRRGRAGRRAARATSARLVITDASLEPKTEESSPSCNAWIARTRTRPWCSSPR